jgi:hypothetical protein
MTGAPVPAGWPADVKPPGAPGWERSAVSWLLDLCPPDYRGHPVLVRRPAVLAWLAGHHVEGQVHAMRRAIATARAELSGLPAPALRETLDAVETELARTLAAQRGLALVAQALSGVRFVPRL